MSMAPPRGFRDIMPEEARVRESLRTELRTLFDAHGYAPIESPLFEDRSTLERAGQITGSPFQVFDTDDRVIMLRPDLTMPIARLSAQRLDTQDFPARLRYEAPVVRGQREGNGQARQFTQVGIELIGGDDIASEVEVISLLAETLITLAIPRASIVCGSVQPLLALLQTDIADQGLQSQILAAIHASNFVALDELIEKAQLPAPVAVALHTLPRLTGDVRVLDQLDEMLEAACVPYEKRGTVQLRGLVEGVSKAGVVSLSADKPAQDNQVSLSFDFGSINSFDYYTGIICTAYCDGCSTSLASGGRYDAVLTRMGLPHTAACGFALSLEALQEARGHVEQARDTRPLRIAIPKGSLFDDTVRILAAAGLPTEPLCDYGRKLIFRAGEVEYIIVRATDAPAFVAHGGADCGICGSDSLIEADLDVIQLVDLAYGQCRFVVAEPASRAGCAERAYARRGTLRVATKYPRITQTYYERRGQQVDVVMLHGNIELGPMVEMSDCIVDITATGTTLRENNLVIVDTVMECRARFFAGPAAYRCDARVRELSERVRAAVQKGAQA